MTDQLKQLISQIASLVTSISRKDGKPESRAGR